VAGLGRICWLGYSGSERAGLLLNAMVRDGRVSAPIVIGRDHLDAGPVASPDREAEQRLGMCLVNDPAMGVIRHADAGYELARDVAEERGLDRGG